MTLYADDVDISLCLHSTCDVYPMAELKYDFTSSLSQTIFKVQSYFLTKYGEYAVINRIYTKTDAPGNPSTPATAS
jgi:hypothetical protein